MLSKLKSIDENTSASNLFEFLLCIMETLPSISRLIDIQSCVSEENGAGVGQRAKTFRDALVVALCRFRDIALRKGDINSEFVNTSDLSTDEAFATACDSTSSNADGPVGASGSQLMRSADVLSKMNADDLEERLRTLKAWFEDAHTIKDRINQNARNMDPPIMQSQGQVTALVDGKLGKNTGWVNVSAQDIFSDAAPCKAFAEGYLAERGYEGDCHEQINAIRASLAERGRHRPEIDVIAADAESVVESMRRPVGFQDCFRRWLVPAVEDPFFSSTPTPWADFIATPWQIKPAAKGLLP